MAKNDDTACADGISWEVLNAYVDEELSPHAAAEVAAAVARDPATAARVATLARLRSTVRALPAGEDAPPPLLPGRARAFSRRPMALAASVGALLVLAGALVWHLDAFAPKEPLLGEAIAAHRQWLSQTPPAPGGRIPVNLSSHQAEGLPNLSMALLQLSYISVDPAMRDGGGLLAGYRGPHGCRLGLWIGPHSGRWSATPSRSDRDGLHIRAWSSDRADYALLSRGMDPERLDWLADIVAHMTLRGPGAEDERIAALRAIPGIGQPCDT
ncbi:putative transmembrane anti-sigma factor [Ancylobacter novellus DSM 506]|uniref:Transmembrane anti-sigma factor n=1 Tax=Ancylobacter novellus (strain ATCC 8093 / DSM 506 / JCM 20403 / CCM 1077 / IAM 12100 / NBRC 12443 / NCIMB 10456) TaxID=639283 RepID=D7A8K7_ANCN5|nr:anti-sigma factor [Ancylobacter novellus]ADH90541.1 putative transmembrane anti-sigma factor [Ancylobacter novellus DSM 506]